MQIQTAPNVDLTAARSQASWPYCSEKHMVLYFRFLCWKRLHTHGVGLRTGFKP